MGGKGVINDNGSFKGLTVLFFLDGVGGWYRHWGSNGRGGCSKGLFKGGDGLDRVVTNMVGRYALRFDEGNVIGKGSRLVFRRQ